MTKNKVMRQTDAWWGIRQKGRGGAEGARKVVQVVAKEDRGTS